MKLVEFRIVSVVMTEFRRGVRIPLVYRLLDFQIKDQSEAVSFRLTSSIYRSVSNCMREDCFELAILRFF